MSILIPSSPGFRSGKPRLVDSGGVQRPTQGAVAIRINRTADHFALDVTPGTARATDEGRILVARLAQALTQGALYAFPQDLDTSGSGAPVVDGAGQAGSLLNLRGFAAGYQVRVGQFFSVIYGGRRYLHMITSDTDQVAGASGKGQVRVAPMLRISPNDGAICEFDTPYIEGFLIGTDLEWQLQTAPFIDAPFAIEEAA